MSDLNQSPSEQPAANHNPIGSPRNFVLACIGFVSLLADEIPALLEHSVQRGSAVLEWAQRETKQRRAAARSDAAQHVAVPDEVQAFGQEVQAELSRLGLPSRQDLTALLQQVAELEREIDRIVEERSKSGN
jgi:hypothetical protein